MLSSFEFSKKKEFPLSSSKEGGNILVFLKYKNFVFEKMNEKLILLFLLLSFVKLSTVKHSEEIWQKFQQYSEEGQILVESRDYFIFDESITCLM